MKLNSLPDVCLREVFARLAAVDMLAVGRVCGQWQALQRSVGCTRRQLSLLIGDDPLDLAWENTTHLDEVLPTGSTNLAIVRPLPARDQLEYGWLTNCDASELTTTFPHLTHLELFIRDVPIWLCAGPKSLCKEQCLIDLITQLLTTWASKLKSLKLAVSFTVKHGERFRQEHYRLLSAVNRLPNLVHLTLIIGDLFKHFDEDIEDCQLSLWLPIVGQLEECYLDIQQDPDWEAGQHGCVLESLARYATRNHKLRQLGIGHLSTRYIGHQHEFFQNKANQALLEKITYAPYLSFVFDEIHQNQWIEIVCDHFSNLQSLSLIIDKLSTLNRALRILSNLHNLFDLTLHILFHCSIDYEQGNQTQAELLLFLNKKAHLPSVKLLTLNTFLTTHFDLHSVPWSNLFPQLEIVHYLTHRLYCCDLDCIRIEYEQNMDRIHKCLHIALQHLTKFDRLRAIYVNEVTSPHRMLTYRDEQIRRMSI